MDLVKIISQYLLLPALLAVFMYYLGKYRERTSQSNLHDKEVFNRINSIINAEDVVDIVNDASQGYLTMATHAKSDDLFYFNNNAVNQFLDKKLQHLYITFIDSLHKLSILYASSPYADLINSENKIVKLVYHKRGNIDGAEDKLICENLKLTKDLERAYSNFRLLIKNRFFV